MSQSKRQLLGKYPTCPSLKPSHLLLSFLRTITFSPADKRISCSLIFKNYTFAGMWFRIAIYISSSSRRWVFYKICVFLCETILKISDSSVSLKLLFLSMSFKFLEELKTRVLLLFIKTEEEL